MSAQRRQSARGDAVASASSRQAEKRQRAAKPKPAEAPSRNVLAVRTERLRGVVQDTMSEMKKINWPDQQTTRNLTIVVIALAVALGALLGTIDYLLVQLLGLF